jgi:UDP-N-acetylglucosamine 4,6-dehydratase
MELDAARLADETRTAVDTDFGAMVETIGGGRELGTVLVTGGTGAFGQAFVRRILACHQPASVRVLSRSEAKQAEMRATFTDPRLRYLIGDVRDQLRMQDACRGVDTVVHAAALKRVEACEADPSEAVRTNIQGTENVIRGCVHHGVRRAVLLSTDKASSPNTLYGMTKATAERVWVASNAYAAGLQTRFSATRYGNVLGSTGSVVPVWRRQAKESGEIVVTDPAMTRFWMTMDDAVDLVLTALNQMRGGEVFVPKIGAASILTLANAIAPYARHRIVGSRPGEKLHESLLGADELAYDAGEYFVIEPQLANWETRRPPAYPRVPDRFEYRSDTARTLSTQDLQEMLR